MFYEYDTIFGILGILGFVLAFAASDGLGLEFLMDLDGRGELYAFKLVLIFIVHT